MGTFRAPASRLTKRQRARKLVQARRQLRAATLILLIHFQCEGWFPNMYHAFGSHGFPRLDNYRSLEVQFNVGMLLRPSVHSDPLGGRLSASEDLNLCSIPLPLQVPILTSAPLWVFYLFSPCLGYPGEGPKLGFVSVNTTSCCKHKNDLVALSALPDGNPVHIVFMQETRISASGRSNLVPFLKREGWDIVIGYQPPVKRVASKHSQASRQTHGGLATLYRGGISVSEIPLSAEFKCLTAHTQFLWCSSREGGFYVLNCYLPAGGDKRHERCFLLDRIFELAASFSNFPVFIVGDFQEEPGSYPPMQRAFMSGDWVDLYANQQEALQMPLEASFAKSGWKTGYGIGPGKTRVDYVLSNRKATCLFHYVQYLRGRSFPGHTPILCSLNDEIFNETVWVLKPHPKWHLPQKPCTDEQGSDRENICQPILQRHIDCLLQAAASQDEEATWTIACRIAAEMLNALSLQQIPSTRGSAPGFRKTLLVPHDTKPCRFSKAQKIVRSKCLLKELLFRAHNWPCQPKYCWTQDLYNTVRNLRNLCTQLGLHCSIECQNGPSLAESTTNMLLVVQQFEDELSRRERDEHLRQWKTNIQVSSRRDKKEVHRWLKGFSVGPPKTFKTPKGNFVASPSAMLGMIEEHMQRIYSYHADTDPYDAFDKFKNKYGPYLDSLKHLANLPVSTTMTSSSCFRNGPLTRPRGWMAGPPVNYSTYPLAVG